MKTGTYFIRGLFVFVIMAIFSNCTNGVLNTQVSNSNNYPQVYLGISNLSSTATQGLTFGLTVTLYDNYGNVITSGADSTALITLNIASGPGNLVGTTSQNAIAGVAQFGGGALAFDTPGIQTLNIGKADTSNLGGTTSSGTNSGPINTGTLCNSGSLTGTCTISTPLVLLLGQGIIGSGNLTVSGSGSISAPIAKTSTIQLGGDLTVGVSTTISGNLFITASDIFLNSGGTITADNNGYAGGAVGGFSGTGPGAGGGSGVGGGGGAGHGGIGGAGSSGGGGGVNYDSSSATLMGSGGGASSTAAGGAGGGILNLTATNTINISGTLTANGASGPCISNYSGGGGSGGSLHLTAFTFTGTGTITVNGGQSSACSTTGGGGGGGIISRVTSSNTYTGSYSESGGSGFVTGSTGALY